MTPSAPKPIHSLVLDAAPILTNNPSVSTLLGQAEELYSVPSVIDEIRDATARARLETTLLPFLKIRRPRPASIKAVTDFARRTGDLEVLSAPDVQILALTYELECERNGGDWRLRSVPGQKRLNGAAPGAEGEKTEGEKTEEEKMEGGLEKEVEEKERKVEEKEKEKKEVKDIPETRTVSGTFVPGRKKSQVAQDIEKELLDAKADLDATKKDIEAARDAQKEAQAAIEASAKEVSAAIETMEEKIAETRDAEEGLARLSIAEPAERRATLASISEPEPEAEAVQVCEDDEDDEEGWITPSNIKKVQAKEDKTVEPGKEPAVMQAACITADFAMQNVLLRMNLNLLSPSLARVRMLKSWVLRCHACFHICRDMSKQFCPRCGKPTLLRASCSTDKEGNFKVHLKKNFQYNARGDRFSIPKPVGGSSNTKRVSGGGQGGWGTALILAEDQNEYVQQMEKNRRRKTRDLMDEDYLPGLLSGDRKGSEGKPKVGAGRNVNSRKRH